jgi:pimeloyl-ACP methyl ester carboxylesterase
VARAELNGVEVFYEDTGAGTPVVFCHEFGGDYRSWDPQIRAFTRFYRCITWNYRGFPPSAVPDDPAEYSEDHLIEDLRALMAHLGIDRAHLVGFSMGGSLVLNFALRHPAQCLGVAVVGAGAGTTERELFERDVARTADLLQTRGIRAFADTYAEAASRQPFKRKDPYGWGVFREQLAQHSPIGQRFTILGVQLARRTIFDHEPELDSCRVPMLVVIGDEDEACVDAAVFLKRRVASAGLLVIPQSGHAVNLEEPSVFNAAVLEFLRLVDADRWPLRAMVSTGLLPEPARA